MQTHISCYSYFTDVNFIVQSTGNDSLFFLNLNLTGTVQEVELFLATLLSSCACTGNKIYTRHINRRKFHVHKRS